MTINSKSYSNYRHAAVVLKSLTKATANKFLAQLDPTLSQKIVIEMRQTRVTTNNLREAIARLKSEGIGPSFASNSPSIHDRIDRVDDVNSETSFGNVSGLSGKPNLDFSKAQTVRFEKEPFQFLKHQTPEVLGRLFSDMQVRNAAIVLSTLSFEFASERLKAIDGSRKVEIMRAIADLDDLHPAEVIDLKFAVRLQIQQLLKVDANATPNPSVSTPQSDKHPQGESTKLRERDAAHSRKFSLVEQGKLIASLLQLPDKKVKELLESIDTACLAPGLKMCPISVQKKVLNNMAKKPAKILSNEILNVRVDDKHRITKARTNIATAIAKLKS